MSKRYIAVLLSGGSGSRFGADTPKQYIHLAGKPIIEYTIEAFQNHEQIDEICIVANQEFHTYIQEICASRHFDKVTTLITGGKERRASSMAAINHYENHEDDICLIFHDAVRPFVSDQIISNTIDALQRHKAIDVAIPAADTIIQIDPATMTIDNIPTRATMQRGQTPQAFHLETIKAAHEAAQNDVHGITVTDDCGLIKHYQPDTPVYVVKGEEKNIKITYPEDLLFAEKLIQLNSHHFTAAPELSGLKEKVIVVYGGNSGIGQAIMELATANGANCLAFSRENGVDITHPDHIDNSLQQAIETFGRIDHVINCAAILEKSSLHDFSDTQIHNTIATNLTGAIFLGKHAYPYLQKSKGTLTFFTSSSYTRGRSDYSLYSATKSAIVNLTQALAEEWNDEGICVNAINPARTRTPLRSANFGEEPEESLLTSELVAERTLQTLLSGLSGLVIDIKKGIDG
jgi:ribitol-5-phosphate 2-dehydrogenase (NADP+) / D-ribitol-5-phosphate cytidylyltransferase